MNKDNTNAQNVQLIEYLNTYFELEPFMDQDQKMDFLIKLLAVAEAAGARQQVERLATGMEEMAMLERDSAAGVELL